MISTGNYLNKFIVKICQHSHRSKGVAKDTKNIRISRSLHFFRSKWDQCFNQVNFKKEAKSANHNGKGLSLSLFVVENCAVSRNVNNFDNGIKWTSSTLWLFVLMHYEYACEFPRITAHFTKWCARFRGNTKRTFAKNKCIQCVLYMYLALFIHSIINFLQNGWSSSVYKQRKVIRFTLSGSFFITYCLTLHLFRFV